MEERGINRWKEWGGMGAGRERTKLEAREEHREHGIISIVTFCHFMITLV